MEKVLYVGDHLVFLQTSPFLASGGRNLLHTVAQYSIHLSVYGDCIST